MMQHSFGDTPIPRRPLAGTDRAASVLVMGTSAFGALGPAAAVFDRFVAHGGNFFDTAHVYGQTFDPGCCERTLGAWMRSRGLRRELLVLGKGGHPPNTSPEAMERDLDESLDRLTTDYLDIYMLHRDSPTVPLAEVVDILCSFMASGRIRAYGFSNWTMERMQAVRRYAQSKGLPLPAALSNNLSLAVMEKPIYPGCVSASDRTFREWLAESGCTLIPWSSQARGVFTAIERPEALGSSVFADCWYSETNVERLRRAHQLARVRGVLPVNVALAWVLQQPFPTFPIIGPRSVDQLQSSLGALSVALSKEEIAWLNLEYEDLISGSSGDDRASVLHRS